MLYNIYVQNTTNLLHHAMTISLTSDTVTESGEHRFTLEELSLCIVPFDKNVLGLETLKEVSCKSDELQCSTLKV